MYIDLVSLCAHSVHTVNYTTCLCTHTQIRIAAARMAQPPVDAIDSTHYCCNRMWFQKKQTLNASEQRNNILTLSCVDL